MQDTHAYDGRIDRDLTEPSPSCGYREVASVMHAEDGLAEEPLEGDDLEDDSMLRDSSTDLEVLA